MTPETRHILNGMSAPELALWTGRWGVESVPAIRHRESRIAEALSVLRREQSGASVAELRERREVA